MKENDDYWTGLRRKMRLVVFGKDAPELTEDVFWRGYTWIAGQDREQKAENQGGKQ